MTTGPTGGPRANLVAVNHVGVSVRDLALAHTFWTEVLQAQDHGAFGWPVGSAPADESLDLTDTAAEVVLLRTDTAFVELFAFSSPSPVARADDAPGVSRLTWAVTDVAATVDATRRHGGSVVAPGVIHCPDGVRIELVGDRGVTGLVGVEVQVATPRGHVLAHVPGPVRVELVAAAGAGRPRPVDLGVNHVCVDVEGIDEVRAAQDQVRWHHPVTVSSGGAAAVCYGTTSDGVLLELLESRATTAFFHRCRLPHG